MQIIKLSGRGLGFTGGTLDKLESIPGMRTQLTEKELLDQVERIGLVVCAQTADLVPADKRSTRCAPSPPPWATLPSSRPAS
jgi:pyrimidine-nucleoside phosphorylase